MIKAYFFVFFSFASFARITATPQLTLFRRRQRAKTFQPQTPHRISTVRSRYYVQVCVYVIYYYRCIYISHTCVRVIYVFIVYGSEIPRGIKQKRWWTWGVFDLSARDRRAEINVDFIRFFGFFFFFRLFYAVSCTRVYPNTQFLTIRIRRDVVHVNGYRAKTQAIMSYGSTMPSKETKLARVLLHRYMDHETRI